MVLCRFLVILISTFVQDFRDIARNFEFEGEGAAVMLSIMMLFTLTASRAWV